MPQTRSKGKAIIHHNTDNNNDSSSSSQSTKKRKQPVTKSHKPTNEEVTEETSSQPTQSKYLTPLPPHSSFTLPLFPYPSLLSIYCHVRITVSLMYCWYHSKRQEWENWEEERRKIRYRFGSTGKPERGNKGLFGTVWLQTWKYHYSSAQVCKTAFLMFTVYNNNNIMIITQHPYPLIIFSHMFEWKTSDNKPIIELLTPIFFLDRPGFFGHRGGGFAASASREETKKRYGYVCIAGRDTDSTIHLYLINFGHHINVQSYNDTVQLWTLTFILVTAVALHFLLLDVRMTVV